MFSISTLSTNWKKKVLRKEITLAMTFFLLIMQYDTIDKIRWKCRYQHLPLSLSLFSACRWLKNSSCHMSSRCVLFTIVSDLLIAPAKKNCLVLFEAKDGESSQHGVKGMFYNFNKFHFHSLSFTFIIHKWNRLLDSFCISFVVV